MVITSGLHRARAQLDMARYTGVVGVRVTQA